MSKPLDATPKLPAQEHEARMDVPTSHPIVMKLLNGLHAMFIKGKLYLMWNPNDDSSVAKLAWLHHTMARRVKFEE